MLCPEPERWCELADPARRGELEIHLDQCEDCRELVAALARTSQAAEAGHARIGRYEIEGSLGAGGMGLVLAARDPDLARTVALKLVRVVERAPDAVAQARERLIDEARAMARLAHPNVVAVYEVVTSGGELFIAMERVDGADLATWLAGAPRSRAEILRVLAGAARGIAAAHAAGLVHRDIKPANILIGRDGRARLTDLGLAAPSGAPASSRLVGTPGYLAPEVIAGGAADARSDQYAFAVTARGALGDSRLVARALARQPADRFPSMAALAARLEAAARPRWPRYAIAALAAGALAFAIAWWRAPAAAAPCDADPTAGGAWTPARRVALVAAIAARDGSPDHQLTARVVDMIDRRARGWGDAVHDVCTARSRGTASTAAADQRGSCLDGVRDELAATIAAITAGAKPARALTAAAHLGGGDACRASPPSAPDDPMHRAVRAELAAIAALRATGKYADAQRRLRELATHDPGDDPRLSATIAYRLGDLEMRTGHGADGLPHVHEAVAIAERAHDDATRLHAMIVLLTVLDELGREKEATALAPLLAAAAARDTLSDSEQSTLENTLGNIAHTTGDYPASERHYRAALAATEREYEGVPSPEVAGALDSVGTALHTLGKPDEAKDLLTRSVAMFEATVGPDHPDLAIAIQELATLAFEAGDLDRAQTLLERVIAIRTTALGAAHPYLCEPTGMLAQVEQRRGHVDRALALHRRALELAERGLGPQHPLVAVAEGHIAELLADRSEPGARADARRLAEAAVATWDASGASLPDASDARFLLARLIWEREPTRARSLAEAARAAYAAMAPAYQKPAAPIGAWLAQHPAR